MRTQTVMRQWRDPDRWALLRETYGTGWYSTTRIASKLAAYVKHRGHETHQLNRRCVIPCGWVGESTELVSWYLIHRQTGRGWVVNATFLSGGVTGRHRRED